MTYFSKVSAQAFIYVSFHLNNISKLNIFKLEIEIFPGTKKKMNHKNIRRTKD